MFLRNVIFLLIAVASSLFLSGCSTLVSGTSENVAVDTGSIRGAKCLLQNDKGKWVVNETPGNVDVHKSFQDLSIECQKQGYEKAATKVKSNVKGTLFGNVILGGVIGIGIDTVNGAGFDYPNNIQVPMV